MHSMYYNFVRILQTLKVTPAMAAGVTDRLWEMSDIVVLSEAWEQRQEEERKAKMLSHSRFLVAARVKLEKISLNRFKIEIEPLSAAK